MKNIILSLCAALPLALPAFAGEVAPGSVPGTLNYQGRLERDNAPITGPVHLYFRVYNSPTAVNTGACGAVAQPCLWESPEITAQATQGIFSADLTPPASVLSGGARLYLEVQVESDTLSPREPLNSVAYAVVSKHLEDGASVRFSTLTATYNVMLATAPAAYMTVGTDAQDGTARLTVDGWLKLTSGGIIFANNTSMNSSGVGSASGISSNFDADMLADSDGNGSGDIVLRKPSLNFLRITNTGKVGVGPAFTADGGASPPLGLLDVDGTLYVGNEGIYDRDDSTVNVRANLGVDTGIIYGKGDESLRLGETSNVIALVSGGAERARVHSNGFFGVGTAAPAVRLHSANDIAADDGVRGGRVSIGDYSTWTDQLNEVRSQAGYHLLLQQTNPFNVGIGTDTPREKLHVRGSVMSDYGVIAATAAFSGNVRVDGDLDANSSNGNMVYLSSTIVYGSLQVTGGIGSMAGIPAYIASSNTFTGQNTFINQVAVSSDVIVNSRLGVGAIGFDFPGDDYLQVGGNTSEFAHNAAAYLVAGSTGEARVAFYRGPVKAASLETLSGNYLPNLALVVGGQAKTVTDSVYHRVQNSVVWISTGYNTTPSIFVSSTIGNVGMGTSVMDPNWRLTVAGNLRIDGSGNGIIFPDGTSIVSAQAIGSANSISANADAVITSNADLVGGGNVILRAGSLDGVVLNTGGNVGIGTINPVSRLNVRGGDLVLGTPLNPYSADSVEDLVVAGNIAFDGELLQRSNSQVRLSGLMVASDVYLSTAAAARTGIGTITPQTKLEVNGDAQFGSGLTKSTFTSAGALQLASPLGVAFGGAGASLSAVATGGILYKSGVATVGGSAALTGMVKGNTAGAPTAITGTAGYNTYWVDANTIAAEQFADVTRGGTGVGTFILNGVLYGNGTSALQDTAAGTQYQVLRAGVGGVPAFGSINLDQAAAVTGTLPVGNGGTGATTLTGVLRGNGTGAFSAMTGTSNRVARWSDANTINDSSILTDNGTRFGVGAPIDATGAITTSSSGTFKASGATQYSVETASGILVNNGVLNMTTGRIINLGSPLTSSDAATRAYVDNASGGGYGAWGLRGNDINDLTDFLGTSLADDLVFKTTSLERLRITAGGTIRMNGFGAGFVKSDGSGNLSGANTITLGTDTIGNYANSASEGGAASDVACTNCISLNSEVNNTLPVGNGGTGATTLTGFVRGSGTAALTAAAIDDADVPDTITLTNITQITNRAISNTTGTLAVGRGGTGVTSLASNEVLLGGATVGSVSVAANNVLLGSAGAPTSGKVTSSYTTGVSDSFVVYSSTGAAGQCRTLTITNGMLTAITAAGACPAP